MVTADNSSALSLLPLFSKAGENGLVQNNGFKDQPGTGVKDKPKEYPVKFLSIEDKNWFPKFGC
jgi:hypothetical protein